MAKRCNPDTIWYCQTGRYCEVKPNLQMNGTQHEQKRLRTAASQKSTWNLARGVHDELKVRQHVETETQNPADPIYMWIKGLSFHLKASSFHSRPNPLQKRHCGRQTSCEHCFLNSVLGERGLSSRRLPETIENSFAACTIVTLQVLCGSCAPSSQIWNFKILQFKCGMSESF